MIAALAATFHIHIINHYILNIPPIYGRLNATILPAVLYGSCDLKSSVPPFQPYQSLFRPVACKSESQYDHSYHQQEEQPSLQHGQATYFDHTIPYHSTEKVAFSTAKKNSSASTHHTTTAFQLPFRPSAQYRHHFEIRQLRLAPPETPRSPEFPAITSFTNQQPAFGGPCQLTDQERPSRAPPKKPVSMPLSQARPSQEATHESFAPKDYGPTALAPISLSQPAGAAARAVDRAPQHQSRHGTHHEIDSL